MPQVELERDHDSGGAVCVAFPEGGGLVRAENDRGKSKGWEFDQTFDFDSKQEQIYKEVLFLLLSQIGTNSFKKGLACLQPPPPPLFFFSLQNEGVASSDFGSRWLQRVHFRLRPGITCHDMFLYRSRVPYLPACPCVPLCAFALVGA